MRNRVVEVQAVINRLIVQCPHCADAITEFVTFLYQITKNVDETLQGANYQKAAGYRFLPFRRVHVYRLSDNCCVSFQWKKAVVVTIEAMC